MTSGASAAGVQGRPPLFARIWPWSPHARSRNNTGPPPGESGRLSGRVLKSGPASGTNLPTQWPSGHRHGPGRGLPRPHHDGAAPFR